MNLYEKMLKISEEIGRVAKNLEIDTGKYSKSYKAVSEADVISAVKPIETKYGVYSFPISRKIVDSGTMVSTTKDGREKGTLFLRVETTYRFVNVENPDEYIDMISYGDGVDPQDKAPGKAMTYSDKYSLLKAYKIITGDDPDGEASNDFVSIQKDIPYEQKPCDEADISRIESMCKTYKWNPADMIPGWPNITKGTYTEFIEKVREAVERKRQEKKAQEKGTEA